MNSIMVRRLYPLWTEEDTDSTSLVNAKVGTEPKACKSNIPAMAPELSPRPRCPQLVTWRIQTAVSVVTAKVVLGQPCQPSPREVD